MQYICTLYPHGLSIITGARIPMVSSLGAPMGSNLSVLVLIDDLLLSGSCLVNGIYSMVVIQTFDTYVSHMLKGVFTNCDTWLVLRKSWRMPHVGQEMLTLSGTPDFIPFRSSWFHPFIIPYIICQSFDYVYGLMTLVCLPGLVWLLCVGTYFIDNLSIN